MSGKSIWGRRMVVTQHFRRKHGTASVKATHPRGLIVDKAGKVTALGD